MLLKVCVEVLGSSVFWGLSFLILEHLLFGIRFSHRKYVFVSYFLGSHVFQVFDSRALALLILSNMCFGFGG